MVDGVSSTQVVRSRSLFHCIALASLFVLVTCVVNSHRWAAIIGFSHAVPYEGVTVQLIWLLVVTRAHCVVAHNRLTIRCESKICLVKSLVSTHPVCPCKNKLSPHELDYLII